MQFFPVFSFSFPLLLAYIFIDLNFVVYTSYFPAFYQ